MVMPTGALMYVGSQTMYRRPFAMNQSPSCCPLNDTAAARCPG